MKPSTTIAMRWSRGGEHHPRDRGDFEAAQAAQDFARVSGSMPEEDRFDDGDLVRVRRVRQAGAAAGLRWQARLR